MDNMVEIVVDGDKLSVPAEFFDFLKVVAFGAKKYGNMNFLEPDGSKCSHKDMGASMFRHLAEFHAGVDRDWESGFDPLDHLMTRAAIAKTRKKRGLTHSEDVK